MYGYDPNDANEDQVTQYVYGQGINNRWVTEIRYPGSNGQASSASADKVVFTYNHDGTVATRTDQNGSVITYEYDTLRRKTHERVTTVGSGVDDAVLQNVTTYDTAGRVEKITQRDSATKDSGSVVNEVKFSYDGLGQLTKDEQDPNGVVNGSTLPTGSRCWRSRRDGAAVIRMVASANLAQVMRSALPGNPSRWPC